jgi:LysM repeat protein
MQPAAEPSLAKQRELCLRPAHETCATYVTARALEEGEEPDPRVDAGLWPSTQQSVLALEPAHAAARPLPTAASRTGGQALLAGLMVAAFLVIAIAGTTPSGAEAPGASLEAAVVVSAPALLAPASATASPVPTLSPVPSPSARVAASPSPSRAVASPTPVAPASPSPLAPTDTYRVRGGDTLSSIAIDHGISVRQLRKANGLDGNMIRPGQELVIP